MKNASRFAPAIIIALSIASIAGASLMSWTDLTLEPPFTALADLVAPDDPTPPRRPQYKQISPTQIRLAGAFSGAVLDGPITAKLSGVGHHVATLPIAPAHEQALTTWGQVYGGLDAARVTEVGVSVLTDGRILVSPPVDVNLISFDGVVVTLD